MSSQYPAIPAPTMDQTTQMRVLQAVKETLELMTGRRGNADTTALTGSSTVADTIARAAAAAAQTAATTGIAAAGTAQTAANAAQADATLALNRLQLMAINGIAL